MNCRKVVNLMSAYVDGELTGTEMLEIRRHMSECSECSEEHESTLVTKRALSRLRTMTPREHFVASMMSSLEAVEIPRYQRLVNSAARFAHRKLSPVAAALAASGVALVLMSAGGMDNMQPPAGTEVVASAPFEMRSSGINILPEVHSSPMSIASYRPLVVAHDTTDFASPGIEFASYVGAR
ncbi:MAG: zf-HC2 domain-containing protein [Armatimonadetes bacterium]|nr:zf-HC2 domain-containing protein [Armatimonadota bacterium]